MPLFFQKIQQKNPGFIYLTSLIKFFNTASFLIIVITSMPIIKRLRSSPLPDSASVHRRQENKLTWLTYKIRGIFFAFWLPPFVTLGLFQLGGIRNNTIVNVLVMAISISNFHYVVNPLLFYSDLLKSRITNNIPD